MSRYMGRNGTDKRSGLRVRIVDGGFRPCEFNREKLVGTYRLTAYGVRNFMREFSSDVYGNGGLTYRDAMDALEKYSSVVVASNSNIEVTLRKCCSDPKSVKVYFEPMDMTVSRRIDEIKGKADKSFAAVKAGGGK